MPSRLPLLARKAGALAKIPLIAYGGASVLVTAGVAFVYWPAGLIVAGVFTFGVFVMAAAP